MPPRDERSPLQPRGSRVPAPERGSGASAVVFLGVAVALLGGVGWILSRAIGDATDPDQLAPAELPGQLPLDVSASAAAPAAAPPRCTAVAAGEAFVVGQAPTKAPRAPTDTPPGIPGLDQPQLEEDLGASPFAVILGRGVVTADGFALGALRDGEGGTLATVVTLGRDGRDGRVVRLARSRGDVEPPVVAAAADGSLLVALLEPDAGGRTLRLARVVGKDVTWGAELAQGRDESLAIDVAATGARAIAAWDEPERDGTRIAVAAFPVADPSIATAPRLITARDVDAESPRLAARPGGFWLAYVARGGLAQRAPVPDEKADVLDDDEIDEQRGGERIETSWIEIVPLDENGAAAGAPARVTAREGTILGFDLAPGADGGAVLAWRDDASPTGGGGGTVNVAYVGPGGVGAVRPLIDEDVDDGVPDLLGFAGGSGSGWIAVSSLKGHQAIGRVDDRATVLGPVASERSLGRGEAVAAAGDRLLLATPEGRAVRLRVVACAEDAPVPSADPARPGDTTGAAAPGDVER